jgi:hypothetical protein
MNKRARAATTDLDPQEASQQAAVTAHDGDPEVGLTPYEHDREADAAATDTASFATPTESDLYGRLATPFDVTFRDLRGGVELEYVTGEQVTTRLNDELGFLNWSFRVLEHGIHAEADECWVLGELTVTLDGRTVNRQQFGSQKVKRSRASGTPMDIGFDLKGASTDALKKCASLVGVGLYLWKKEPLIGFGNGGQGQGQSHGANGGGFGHQNGSNGSQGPGRGNGMHVVGGNGGPAASDGTGQGQGSGLDIEPLYCEECSEPLAETRFKDGTNWAPGQLAVFGRRKHNRVLCMTHYREANQAKRRAEEALQQAPF